MNSTHTHQVRYVWEQKPFNTPSEYATAVCCARYQHLFAAIWDSVEQTGYLGQWIPSTSSWKCLGGSFQQPAKGMCSDSRGNIYLIGDQTSSGKYIIKIHNSFSNTWFDIESRYTNPITKICCTSNDTIYFCGDFTDRNHRHYICSYNLLKNSWKKIEGLSVFTPFQDICVTSGDNLAVLFKDYEDTSIIMYWDGSSWRTLLSSIQPNITAIASYQTGTIVYATPSTINALDIQTGKVTELFANIPDSIQNFYTYHLLTTQEVLYLAGRCLPIPPPIIHFLSMRSTRRPGRT